MHSKTLMLCSLLLAFSCNGPVEKKDYPRPLNPNGDSELALLMREMTSQTEMLKLQMAEGKLPEELKRFENIHSAVPTDPKTSGPVFNSFATAYVNAVKQLELSDTATVERFNNLVDQCVNCHSEFCPGPKKKIQQLYRVC